MNDELVLRRKTGPRKGSLLELKNEVIRLTEENEQLKKQQIVPFDKELADRINKELKMNLDYMNKVYNEKITEIEKLMVQIGDMKNEGCVNYAELYQEASKKLQVFLDKEKEEEIRMEKIRKANPDFQYELRRSEQQWNDEYATQLYGNRDYFVGSVRPYTYLNRR